MFVFLLSLNIDDALAFLLQDSTSKQPLICVCMCAVMCFNLFHPAKSYSLILTDPEEAAFSCCLFCTNTLILGNMVFNLDRTIKWWITRTWVKSVNSVPVIIIRQQEEKQCCQKWHCGKNAVSSVGQFSTSVSAWQEQWSLGPQGFVQAPVVRLNALKHIFTLSGIVH